MTADFLYLRINGNERKWIEKVKEKEREMNGWDREEGLDFAIVVVDTHTKSKSHSKTVRFTYEKIWSHSLDW